MHTIDRRGLDESAADFQAVAELYERAASRGARYLAGLGEREVFPDPTALARLEARVGEPLDDEPTTAARVLEELDRDVSAATVATAGPRYFGFVTGGALPASLAAHALAAAWDQNAFSRASSPAAVAVEAIAHHWLLDLLGLPADCASSFTTGASLANFTALAAARHALCARAGHDVEARGLYGAPEIRVYLSAEQHPTVHKALGLLGFGRERVVRLETDAQGRIRRDAIPKLQGPAIVCAQAGNVNSGAFDPFDALADACAEAGAWLHVDGAFGLWAAASPALRILTTGVERADSWATDAHKWLNVPYDSGLAFVRDREALARAMSFQAAYLPVEGPREPFHTTVEASRRARGFEVWAALRELGRRGVADLVERCCEYAGRFADGLEAAGFEVMNDVVLNQVVVDFGGEAMNEATLEALVREGVCWCGPTHWRGRSAVRISVSSWATRSEDVERSLESMERAAAIARDAIERTAPNPQAGPLRASIVR